MKLKKDCLFGLAAITAIGISLYIISILRKKKKLSRIANEGYETASDILYPDNMGPSKKLHFGPIIPE